MNEAFLVDDALASVRSQYLADLVDMLHETPEDPQCEEYLRKGIVRSQKIVSCGKVILLAYLPLRYVQNGNFKNFRERGCQ